MATANQQPVRSYSERISHSFWHIFEATASSVLACVIGTLAVIWYGGRIAHNGYDFWFLNLLVDRVSLGQLVEVEYSLFNASLALQNDNLNSLLLLVFWVFLGVLVYESIQACLYFFFEIRQDKQLVIYEKPGQQHHVPSLIRTTLVKTIARFLFVALFLLFLALCLRFFWPALVTVFISQLGAVNPAVSLLLITLVLALIGLTFHGLVMLLRLASMRQRLFEKN